MAKKRHILNLGSFNSQEHAYLSLFIIVDWKALEVWVWFCFMKSTTAADLSQWSLWKTPIQRKLSAMTKYQFYLNVRLHTFLWLRLAMLLVGSAFIMFWRLGYLHRVHCQMFDIQEGGMLLWTACGTLPLQPCPSWIKADDANCACLQRGGHVQIKRDTLVAVTGSYLHRRVCAGELKNERMSRVLSCCSSFGSRSKSVGDRECYKWATEKNTRIQRDNQQQFTGLLIEIKRITLHWTWAASWTPSRHVYRTLGSRAK